MATAFPEHFEAPQLIPVEVHINRFFDRLVACVNSRRNVLLTAAHRIREEMAAELRQKEVCEQQLVATRTGVEGNMNENSLRKRRDSIIAEIEEELELLRMPPPETYLMLTGEYEQLEKLIEGIGDIIEEEVPQMKSTVAVAKVGRLPGELWETHSVAIDPITKHIYVAEGSIIPNFARVSIFSEKGEYLKCYSDSQMKRLHGIAIHGQKAYITDWDLHAVFHIKIKPDFCLVGTIGSYGSDIGQFNYPQQLSISKNGDLYIADWGNNRIQILASSLLPIREITHPSMHKPCDVKLSSDEVYVLSDHDNPCVHVFSNTGDKLRSLISRGMDMQVIKPYCFCLDRSNGLIISDTHAHQIIIFSKEGTILHHVGQYGQDIGMFDGDTGVALTSDLKLVTVSNNDNCRLQIFSFL